MKHFKIMLTALIFVGFIGASMAFKVAKFTSFFIYQKNGTFCPVLLGQFDPNLTGTKFINVFTSTTGTLVVPASRCTGIIFATPE
jgi:hypothetical protein